MRCFICDAIVTNPQFNTDHKDWDPCPKCQEEITALLNGYKDQVVFTEDGLDINPEDLL